MATFKVKVNGEFEDEVFYSESDAVDHALYLASCTKEGAAVMFWAKTAEQSDIAMRTMSNLMYFIRLCKL